MPCNSEILVTVDLGANVDTGLLMQALTKINGSPTRLGSGAIAFTIPFRNGWTRGTFGVDKRLELRLTSRSREERETVNEIKAAYSYEVVMSAVRRVGASALSDTTSGANVVHVRLNPGS